MQEADENARGKGKTIGKQHPTWFSWLLSWVQRADQESYTCYVLFVLIFILDFSLLTMLFPVSLAAYVLATQRPSRLYWQVSLFAALRCAALRSQFCPAIPEWMLGFKLPSWCILLLEHKTSLLTLHLCWTMSRTHFTARMHTCQRCSSKENLCYSSNVLRRNACFGGAVC